MTDTTEDGKAPVEHERLMHEIGRRLRDVRDQQDLTLADVETATGGRFTAAAVASWERGDRNVAMPKLAELAAFYRIPVNELIPNLDQTRPPEQDAPAEQRGPVTIKLDELRDADTPGVDVVRRYVDRIRDRRGDSGTRITLRQSDLRALAALLGVTVDDCRRLLALTTPHSKTADASSDARTRTGPAGTGQPHVIITLDDETPTSPTPATR